jgi:hypothetical protein
VLPAGLLGIVLPLMLLILGEAKTKLPGGLNSAVIIFYRLIGPLRQLLDGVRGEKIALHQLA